MKSVTKAIVGLIIALWKENTKVTISIVLQIILTKKKMIMFFLGTGGMNKTIFLALKMLEVLAPIITQKLSKLLGTS